LTSVDGQTQKGKWNDGKMLAEGEEMPESI